MVGLSDDDRAEIAEVVRTEVRAALAEPQSPQGRRPAQHAEPGGPPPGVPTSGARLGFPVHALLGAVPLGAFTCSFLFDLAAHLAPEPYTYPRSAYWLLVIGLVSGLLATVVGLLDHRRLPLGSAAERGSRRHLVVAEAALAGYVLSFFLRRETDFIDEVPLGIVVLSGLCLLALWWSAADGARLTYRLGVGRAVPAPDGPGPPSDQD